MARGINQLRDISGLVEGEVIFRVGGFSKPILASLSSRNPPLRGDQTFFQGPEPPLEIQLVLAAVAAEP